MQTNQLSLARKIILGLACVLSLALLTGCEFRLTNLTPDTLPENPSQIYTLTVRVHQRTTSVVPDSVTARVIVDGQTNVMKKSALGDDIYEFDYKLRPGQEEIAYYFLVTYRLDTGGRELARESFTEVMHSRVLRRNVLALTANRGPVGANITVLGRGFTQQDVVFVENQPARTTYVSPNTLNFVIPNLEPNRSYTVSLGGPTGTALGTFRIDEGGTPEAPPAPRKTLQVSPASLTLRPGQRLPVTFTLGSPAGPGGELIDVTTDVSQSVIMPEVIVSAGQTRVQINVEGGRAGTGSLFIKGYGDAEIRIPVTVR